MTTVIKLSPQQTAFLDWIKNGVGSCVLIAVAGAGKTFSLVKAIELLKGSTAVLAFNKKIADEIGEKIAHVASALAGTVHSFGFRALGKAYGKIKVDGYKVNNLVQDLILNDRPDLKPYEAAIVKLVGYAKQRALGVIGSIDDDSAWFDIIVHFDVFADVDEDEENPIPQEEVVRVARLILNKSNKITNVVDFDDMVYLPTFLNVPMNRFDNVLVDEAQDTNAARRALVRALLKPNGRLVAVGDPCQAIYGFHFCNAMTAANLRKLNGMDERLWEGIAYEDNMFKHQIQNLGLRFEFIDDPFVYHQWHDRFYEITEELVKRNYTTYLELQKSADYRAVHVITPDL